MSTRSISKKVCSVSLMICLFMAACSDNAVGPPGSQPQSGLIGTVVDSSGQRLDSVSIFCLYTTTTIPTNVASKSNLSRLNGVDTFAFRLYQNFPNPFSHSTFVRFSLAKDAGVRLSLRDRLDGSVKYTFVDTLTQGLYQLYLYRVVDSLQLRNGLYTLTFEATAAGAVRYTAATEMFVVSDSGAPSARTDARGAYGFDYAQAFVGDSATWTSDGNTLYQYQLTNSVFLLFRRNGYRAELLNATLVPNILLQRDVVLFREN